VDRMVGVAALALTLIPATSPGALVTPETQAAMSSSTESAETGTDPLNCDPSTVAVSGSTGLLNTAVPCSPSAADSTRVSRCAAQFRRFGALETRDGSSFSKFVIESFAGIADLEWVDPLADHTFCPEPIVDFNGSIYVQARSNAGSFIASNTKASPLAVHSATLHLEDLFVAAVWQTWETAKVSVAYDFPFSIVIHNYAPPAGDYQSEGSGHAQWRNGLRYVGTTKTAKDFKYTCIKQGDGASQCSQITV
jgi:hypothetical protein